MWSERGTITLCNDGKGSGILGGFRSRDVLSILVNMSMPHKFQQLLTNLWESFFATWTFKTARFESDFLVDDQPLLHHLATLYITWLVFPSFVNVDCVYLHKIAR